LQQKSYFIIATNDIDETVLGDEQVVKAYKMNQQKKASASSFIASTLFLK